MKTLTALTVGTALTALLAGCSPPQNPIVGRWQSASAPAHTIEFYGDGTFHASSGDGTYKFPDASHIILVPEAGDLFSSLKTIRVDNDTLIFTSADAYAAKPRTERLRRVEG